MYFLERKVLYFDMNFTGVSCWMAVGHEASETHSSKSTFGAIVHIWWDTVPIIKSSAVLPKRMSLSIDVNNNSRVSISETICFLMTRGRVDISEIHSWSTLWWELINQHWVENDLICQATSHYLIPCLLTLTHWGRVMHVCISKLTTIGSDNGLLPGRRLAIIWTNAELL